MKNSLSFYIKPFLIVAAVAMAIVCYIQGTPQNLKGWFEHIGTVSIVMGFILWLYIKWIWRYCPWKKIPRFAKQYKGEIRYLHGDGGTKKAEIFISQTLFFIDVKIKTDEITSDTVTSDLVEEHNSWLLYYTYQTNPQATVSEKNPAQYGTTRLEIEKPEYNFRTWFLKHEKTIERLEGKYWTTSKTTGDMVVTKESKK